MVSGTCVSEAGRDVVAHGGAGWQVVDGELLLLSLRRFVYGAALFVELTDGEL